MQEQSLHIPSVFGTPLHGLRHAAQDRRGMCFVDPFDKTNQIYPCCRCWTHDSAWQYHEFVTFVPRESLEGQNPLSMQPEVRLDGILV